jgi:hypothetical protein
VPSNSSPEVRIMRTRWPCVGIDELEFDIGSNGILDRH